MMQNQADGPNMRRKEKGKVGMSGGAKSQPLHEEELLSIGERRQPSEWKLLGKYEEENNENEAKKITKPINNAVLEEERKTSENTLVDVLPQPHDKTDMEVELLVAEHKKRIKMMLDSRNILNSLIETTSNKYKDAKNIFKIEYKKDFFTLKRSLHALLRAIKLSDEIVRGHGQQSLVDQEIYINSYYKEEEISEYIREMDAKEESVHIYRWTDKNIPNIQDDFRLTYSAFSAAKEEAIAINPAVRNLRNTYQEFLAARLEYAKATEIAAREKSDNTFNCRDYILKRFQFQKDTMIFPVQRVAAPRISMLDTDSFNEWSAKSSASAFPSARLLKDSDLYGILNRDCKTPPFPYKTRTFHLADYDRQLPKEDDIKQQLPPSMPNTNVTFTVFRPWILSRKLYFKRVTKRRRRYSKLNSNDKLLVKTYIDECIEERLKFIEENYPIPDDNEEVDDYDPDTDLIYPAKFLLDLPRPDIYPDPDRPVQQPNALKTSYAYNPTINLWADSRNAVCTSQSNHRTATISGFPRQVSSTHSNSYSRYSQGNKHAQQNQNPQVEIFDPYYDPKVPLQIEGFEHMSKCINLVHPGDINIIIYEGNRIHHDSVRPAFSYPDTPLPGWSKELMIRMAGASKGYNEISYLPPDRSRRIKNKHELIEFVSRNGITNSIVNKFEFRSCFCVCQKPEDSSSKYLECALGYGGCQGWVHSACVGLGSLSESQIEALPTCICPLCALYLEGTDELKYTNGATILSKMTFPVTPAVTYVNGLSIEETTKPPKIWGISPSSGWISGNLLQWKNERYEVSHMAKLVVNASIESKDFQRSIGIIPAQNAVEPLNHSYNFQQQKTSQITSTMSVTMPFTRTPTAMEFITGKGVTKIELPTSNHAASPKKESITIAQPKVESKNVLPILQHRLFSFIPHVIGDKTSVPIIMPNVEKKSVSTPTIDKKSVPAPITASTASISEAMSDDVEEVEENDDSVKAKAKARKFRLTVTGGWMKHDQEDELEGTIAPPHELNASITKLSMYTVSPIAFDIGQLAVDNHNEYGIAHTDLLAADMMDNVLNTPYPPNETFAAILPLEDGGLRTACISCPQTMTSVHDLCTNRIRCAYCYDVITTDAIEITDDAESFMERSKSKSNKSETSKGKVDGDRNSRLIAQRAKKLVEMSFGTVTYQLHPQCAFKLNFDLKQQEYAEKAQEIAMEAIDSSWDSIDKAGSTSAPVDKRYSDSKIVDLLSDILVHPHVTFGSFYEYESVDDAECDLCGRSGGIMQFFDLASDCTDLSPPSEDGWLAHTACLYILTNSSLLSVVSRNEKSVFDQLMSLHRCSICGGTRGLCIRCSAATCTVRAHPLCMIQNQHYWRLTHINQNSDRCLAALCTAHNIK